jgi:hypothetical protein
VIYRKESRRRKELEEIKGRLGVIQSGVTARYYSETEGTLSNVLVKPIYLSYSSSEELLESLSELLEL